MPFGFLVSVRVPSRRGRCPAQELITGKGVVTQFDNASGFGLIIPVFCYALGAGGIAWLMFMILTNQEDDTFNEDLIMAKINAEARLALRVASRLVSTTPSLSLLVSSRRGRQTACRRRALTPPTCRAALGCGLLSLATAWRRATPSRRRPRARTASRTASRTARVCALSLSCSLISA